MMSYLGNKDFALEVSLGNVEGYSHINKFGSSPQVMQNVLTDVWSGADGATATSIWLRLLTLLPRIHNIASTDVADAAGGTGMRTVEVFGLIDWDTRETSEIVTLDGVDDVATVNSYVIVHRMTGRTFGSGGSNAGIITATAVIDNIVEAVIQAGEGQTLMAIYGIPSVQTMHIRGIRADIARPGPAVALVKAEGRLLVQERANTLDSAFVTNERFQFTSQGAFERHYAVPKRIIGPAIVKIQVMSNTDDTIVSSVFDAYVVDN